MSQTLDFHTHQWRAAAGASVANLISRLIASLDDWRERMRLRDELDELDRTGQLDNVLEEVGLTRGQIPALIAGRPGAGERMDQMLQRRGLDRMALRVAGELRDAEWRCQRCETTAECKVWLAADPASADAPSFCPNAPTFELMREQQS